MLSVNSDLRGSRCLIAENILRDLIVPYIPHLESLVQIGCFMIKENPTTDGEVLKELLIHDACVVSWENEQRAASTADVGLNRS